MKKILSIMLLALVFGFTLSGCTQSPASYEISVFINGAIFGRVNDDINGTYTEGEEITIVATPYENQTFYCWLHDGKVVSNLASYTFTVSEASSGSYIALFECEDLEYVYIDSFSLTDNASNDTLTQDRPVTLSSFAISLGYNQNDLLEVYSSKAVDDASVVTTQDESTLYLENALPFAFDKTRNIYIKISLTYLRENLQYTSQTTVIVQGVQIGQSLENPTDKPINTAYCVSVEDLELDQPEPSTISINFKPLSQFNFPEIEPEE